MKNIELIDDINLSEIKKVLSDKSKEKELNYEQKMCLDHAKLFAKITPAKAIKMKEELIEKAEVNSESATKIIDLLPNKTELDLISEKSKDITDDNKEIILEIVEKYKN